MLRNGSISALSSLLVLVCGPVYGQLTTGQLEIFAHDASGAPEGQFDLRVESAPRFVEHFRTDTTGHARMVLPYGIYRLYADTPVVGSPIRVPVAALQKTRVNLLVVNSGVSQTSSWQDATGGLWTDVSGGNVFPEGFSFLSGLGNRQPAAVTVPLDFTGLNDNRLALVSIGARSWTDTEFKLLGLDMTDSYQPGRPDLLLDPNALSEVAVRTGGALLTSTSYGAEVSSNPRQSQADWHAAVSTFNTGSGLSSGNLPPSAERGLLRESERFRWFTRDRVEAGGPVTARADLFASVAGQWSSETVGLASPPNANTGIRALLANVRGRISASARDQLDLDFNRSSNDLSNWGNPAGIEALANRRSSPEYVLPGGFPNEAERDDTNFIQIGWTHHTTGASRLGTVEIRYGYSIGHFDTWPGAITTPFQSRIELLGGDVSGSPPLTTLAGRPRHEIAAVWQPGPVRLAGFNHTITAGGSFKRATPRNLFNTPSNLNLITANGLAAYVVEYNTPATASETVTTLTPYLSDHVALNRTLMLNVGVLGDVSRGSLPDLGTLISWNSVSPRAGLEWQVPHLDRLVLYGSYYRSYAPLAARYLDYGDAHSLGGNVFQWRDLNGDGWFTPDERGPLLMRFGGPYSSISPSLQRPYADEFDVGARYAGGHDKTFMQLDLFRRDEKARIAAIDTGLGSAAFSPVSMLDPGPDGIAGTFDDQRLTAYRQNPATLGQDRYLLTNPTGLRTLNIGFAASVGMQWHGLAASASFTAEKAWGPTNPGDSWFQNDPGVVGQLFMDPNSAVTTLARSYVDRAYLGKLQARYHLPAALAGIEIATLANYSDGLPFARQLLVTGLPQGPFLIAATVRGSPEGGNRAQYLLNWNLRLQREFRPEGSGRFRATADILNVMNASQDFQQIDVTGTGFNSRLPVAIQPPRFLRVGFEYSF